MGEESWEHLLVAEEALGTTVDLAIRGLLGLPSELGLDLACSEHSL